MPHPGTYHSSTLSLERALTEGDWADAPLTETQCAAALSVVKSNALNESDYELLKGLLGL